MSNVIQIWGGRPKQGAIKITPFSKDAIADLPGPYFGYLLKFPTFKYGTDWGTWDQSNSEWISSKISSFAGGGDSIPGKLVQMLGGDYYKPPILTDEWTQLAAQLGKEAYLDFDIDILAYPVIPKPKSGAHVEGLRYDRDNLLQVLRIGKDNASSMWDWIELGKRAMMPSRFSSKIIMDNIGAIKNNLATNNGKLILSGVEKLGSVVKAMNPSSDTTFGEAAKNSLVGLEEIIQGATGAGSRIGHTFTLEIVDVDGNHLINSNAPTAPVDFYIERLDLEFSSHLVKIIDSNGRRMGSCPEYCKVSAKLTSVTKVSPEQVTKMCRYKYGR